MKIEKAQANLGRETVEEMDGMSVEELNATIVQSEKVMKEVRAALEASPEYQKAKTDLSALSQSKKDVDKRQRSKIAYALHLLEEKGEA